MEPDVSAIQDYWVQDFIKDIYAANPEFFSDGRISPVEAYGSESNSRPREDADYGWIHETVDQYSGVDFVFWAEELAVEGTVPIMYPEHWANAVLVAASYDSSAAVIYSELDKGGIRDDWDDFEQYNMGAYMAYMKMYASFVYNAVSA